MYGASQVLALSVSVVLCALAVLYSDFFSTLVLPTRPSSHLSVAEQHQLLASLVFYSSKSPSYWTNPQPRTPQPLTTTISTPPPRIAFCCSADLDVSVPAVALMHQVELQQHQQQHKTQHATTSLALPVRHHERIDSLQELQESFVFYFSSGAAAEQSVNSSAAFHEIVALANALPDVQRKVGGNAATMAARASAEGCTVLLGAAMGVQMKQHFDDPTIQLVGTIEGEGKEDVHLVLEYGRGDAFRGHVSPRANRYYLNHDVHNARLSVLEEFERALETFEPDLVVFGGLQLMEVEQDVRARVLRLEALAGVLQNLYAVDTPTHYEFAAVSDFGLFSDTVRLVLPWVDSIGLNEQELFILHHFLVTGKESTATTSRPTIAEISAQLHGIIQFAKDARETVEASRRGKEDDGKHEVTVALAHLSRIHFHTLQFHVVCQRKKGIWEDPTSALVQSALISSKVACGKPPVPRSGSASDDENEAQSMRTSAEMEVDPERVEMLLAREQLLSERQDLKVDLDPLSPVITWQEADFQCHLVPMLACKKPDYTAGLGDNISGTGIAYHRLQKTKTKAGVFAE